MLALSWNKIKGIFVQTKLILSLTGIRAVAALWVVFGHFSSYLLEDFGVARDTLFQPFFDSAWAGVDLFFVLSGFIIALTYSEDFHLRGFRASSHFWWKRIARLYPVYLLTTLVATVFYLIAFASGHEFNHESESNLDWTTFIANILGVQEWFSLTSLDGPAWSVSAEFFAYLIFPVIAITILKVDSKAFLLGAAGLCFFALFVQDSVAFLNPRIIQIVLEFLLGALIYRATLGIELAAVPHWLALVLRSFFWIVAIVLLYFSGLNKAEWHAPLAITFVALIWLYSLKSAEKSMLATPVFVTLGLWSYSLYLIHRLVQNLTSGIGVPISDSFWVNSLIFMTLIAIPLALAGLCYRIVEEPCRRYLNRRPWFRVAAEAG